MTGSRTKSRSTAVPVQKCVGRGTGCPLSAVRRQDTGHSQASPVSSAVNVPLMEMSNQKIDCSGKLCNGKCCPKDKPLCVNGVCCTSDRKCKDQNNNDICCSEECCNGVCCSESGLDCNPDTKQ